MKLKLREESDVINESDALSEAANLESNEREAADAYKSLDTEREDIFYTIQDGDCLLVTSQDNVLTESKDSISPTESAKMRILAVMRSYLYNLQNGLLITGYDVDYQVVLELKNLIGTTHGEPYDQLSGGYEEVDSRELLEMDDEERVVYEVKRYRKWLLDSGDMVTKDVLATADAIVSWPK